MGRRNQSAGTPDQLSAPPNQPPQAAPKTTRRNRPPLEPPQMGQVNRPAGGAENNTDQPPSGAPNPNGGPA
jgi:hypothetical protein